MINAEAFAHHRCQEKEHKFAAPKTLDPIRSYTSVYQWLVLWVESRVSVPGRSRVLDAILQEISGLGFDGGQARVEVGQSRLIMKQCLRQAEELMLISLANGLGFGV